MRIDPLHPGGWEPRIQPEIRAGQGVPSEGSQEPTGEEAPQITRSATLRLLEDAAAREPEIRPELIELAVRNLAAGVYFSTEAALRTAEGIFGEIPGLLD